MAPWTAFPHPADAYPLRRRDAEAGSGRACTSAMPSCCPATTRCSRRGTAVPCRRLSVVRSTPAWRPHGKGMGAGNDRRQQGAIDLRNVPREKRESEARAAGRGRRARRAARIREAPTTANAHDRLAYGLGRYSQASPSLRHSRKASAPKVKTALETTIGLVPKHADAHTALGAFHAEVIDQVGSLLGLTRARARPPACSQQARPGSTRRSAIAMVESRRPRDARRREADEGGDRELEKAPRASGSTRWSGSTSRWRRPSSKTDRGRAMKSGTLPLARRALALRLRERPRPPRRPCVAPRPPALGDRRRAEAGVAPPTPAQQRTDGRVDARRRAAMAGVVVQGHAGRRSPSARTAPSSSTCRASSASSPAETLSSLRSPPSSTRSCSRCGARRSPSST